MPGTVVVVVVWVGASGFTGVTVIGCCPEDELSGAPTGISQR